LKKPFYEPMAAQLRYWLAQLCGLAACLWATVVDSAPSPYRVLEGEVSERYGALVAGTSGARLVFSGGLELSLLAGTELRLFGSTQLWLDERGKTDVHLFRVERGHLDATVSKPPAADGTPGVFRTPHKLVGVVREGSLGVDVTDVSVFANLGGQVWDSRAKGWSELKDGRLLVKRKGIARAEERVFAEPPVVTSERRVWSGISGDARVGGFQWSRVVNASGYRIIITDDESGEPLYRQRTSDTRMPVRALALPAGRYAISVQAIDSFGFPGDFSEPMTFQVVGFVQGSENYLDRSGVVRVGTARTARFSNTEGLEVTYGSAGPWVQAPPELFFRETQRTVVRFRYPETPGVVSVPVQQQQVRAQIEIEPKTATWPKDDVTVVVSIEDGIDGRAARRLPIQLDASVGLQRLRLVWRKTGNTYRAKVPRQPGEGPWVVRVVAMTRAGSELGREHLEVVSDGWAAFLRARDAARRAAPNQ
jgi:hypothetical protein